MCRKLCATFVLLAIAIPATLPAAKQPAAKSTATDVSAAQLLPDSVVLYAETTSTGDLLDGVLDHPHREKFEAFPPYQKWLKSEGRKQLMFGVSFLEAQLGLPWRVAIEKLGTGGVYFALDGASEGVAILVKTDDEAFLKKTLDTLVNLARADASGKGNSDPFQSTDYRGVQAYRADEVRFAVVKEWLVLTSSDTLGKSIIDRILDGSKRSLAQNARFQAARASRHPSPIAWAYADLASIRAAGVAEELLGGKARDPAAELLFGGVLSTLHKTPFATAQLTSKAGALDLALRLPHDPSWTPVEREFFFGPSDHGAAPPEIALPETILEVSAHRDVSGMWLHGPDLFNERVNAGLAKTNSDLSTLFGGRPFAEEILGALDGGVRFVVVHEHSSKPQATSAALKLPAFAAIARLKDPSSSQRPLRIAFQTAVGFINLTGAERGRPPLEIETERRDGRTLLTASYSPEDFIVDGDDKTMMAAGSSVLLSISPTVAFSGDTIVIASTRSLAIQLLDRLPEITETTEVKKSYPISNTAVSLQAAPLRKALSENRERLIANNMLEKGHDRALAVHEVDVLLTLLKFFEQGNASLQVDEDQLQLSIRLTPVGE